MSATSTKPAPRVFFGTLAQTKAGQVGLWVLASEHGTPLASVWLRADGPGYVIGRKAMAGLYRLAAQLELDTPEGETWAVCVEFGRVWIEDVDHSEERVQRHLKALKAAARKVWRKR